MALSKRLKIYPDDTGNGNWIKFDEFISFMRCNLSAQDKISTIRRDHVKGEFKKITGHTKVVNSEDCISVFAVTKYIFNHTEKVKVCNDIAQDIIQNELQKSKVEIPPKPFAQRTTLNLYEQIAKYKVKYVYAPQDTYVACDIFSPTLLDIHKSRYPYLSTTLLLPILQTSLNLLRSC